MQKNQYDVQDSTTAGGKRALPPRSCFATLSDTREQTSDIPTISDVYAVEYQVTKVGKYVKKRCGEKKRCRSQRASCGDRTLVWVGAFGGDDASLVIDALARR